jgi:two-component system, OmpR family, sensor histidine kinase CpxA
MKLLRFSLFYRIMLWFFLNLILLGTILFLIFNLNFRFEPNSPFFGGATNRIETVSRHISRDIDEKSREQRDAILRQYSETYNVEFFLFDNTGAQLGGREIELPAEVLNQIVLFEPGLSHSSPDVGDIPPPRPGYGGIRPPASPFSLYVKTENPKLYWFGVRMLTLEKGAQDHFRSRLLAVSDSFYGHGLFFDPTPWIVISLVVIGVSMILWLPFVRGITRTVSQMNEAAERIADEDFDVRISDNRSDELGHLGKSINHLAKRLSGYVQGQKRFLGDVSHELNSPLARMQFALSILEDRVDEKNLSYVLDVKEDVELMSKLVAELLAFSKAGIRAPHVELEKIRLRPLIERVVEREKSRQQSDIEIAVGENLEVCAQPELLARAVGNIVRNAVRYAGGAGRISVAAENGNHQIRISVADSGLGVPESDLEKIFDPLYRVEAHRSRETGGTGLGLAIVKTCVEACEGKVFAQNLDPKGFAVTIVLKN